MVKSLFPLNKKPEASFDADKAATDSPGGSSRPGRLGLWALAIGFGGFLLWAAFAPLDEGVPAAGIVAIDTKRKAVQHLSGGIVKEVLVREGDEVKEGQLLIRLDSAVAKANYESVRQRYLGLRAMQGRLLAEQGGLASISYHADLQAAASDPLIRQQMQNQEQLFMTRRSLLRSDLQSIEENIQGQEGLLQAYDGMLASRKSQLSLLNEELGNLRGLVKEGYAPRNRQLEMERMVADSSTAIADLVGNTIRGRRAIGELRQRALSRQQEYRKEVETQLAEVSREVLSDNEKLHAVTDDLGRTEIKAPASGQVVGLAVQTVGGVISPGQKLMDIVPKDASLLLEAHVAPHLIDRVRSELPVDVRFSSFAHSPQLVVGGKVVSISADLLVEPQTNVSYYLARIQVTPEGLKKLGTRQLQPGMPVEVIFKTGERSMLTYLLHPLTKRLAASMTEE
ncbi:HlyD family type I secretion periplasmic adaptor subunit [Acidovorax sp. Root217]|uniref:HlyD family type I secretion periplasmic adaptor subunit n=1 Tax=Acidovorax sp. Root217 TaxID=1736492 RepID=UPI00070CDDFC|nr:HlyD family type I secretion periplasmic adaptor subunit [Acidovorax sp. Root217]KRC28024.1 secretion protein HlyD [Acidovorax sp. Root217]